MEPLGVPGLIGIGRVVGDAEPVFTGGRLGAPGASAAAKPLSTFAAFGGIILLGLGIMLSLSSGSRHPLEFGLTILLAPDGRGNGLGIAHTLALQLCNKFCKSHMMRLILVHK